MNCPKCNVPLSMSDRAGVEIDFCPQCRGVWLDRGELDKIIERSATGPTASRTPTGPPPVPPAYRHDDDEDDDDYRRDSAAYPGRKKKKSFLGDLFDF